MLESEVEDEIDYDEKAGSCKKSNGYDCPDCGQRDRGYIFGFGTFGRILFYRWKCWGKREYRLVIFLIPSLDFLRVHPVTYR